MSSKSVNVFTSSCLNIGQMCLKCGQIMHFTFWKVKIYVDNTYRFNNYNNKKIIFIHNSVGIHTYT